MRILLTILILLIPSLSLATPRHIEGYALITDGDTIIVDNHKIRLEGIDAPEKCQLCDDASGKKYPCGQYSTKHLVEMVQEHKVNCILSGIKTYDRFLGKCYVEGHDISAQMVKDGHAIAYIKYSKEYNWLEELAHKKEIGIWQGYFHLPEEFRKGLHKDYRVKNCR